MAAPASAAASAAPAICSGVTGRYGDMDGVWIAPVGAHVMIAFCMSLLRGSARSGRGRVHGHDVQGAVHAHDEPIAVDVLRLTRVRPRHAEPDRAQDR